MSVLAEIAAERARQDAKWGGPTHDDEHEIDEFFGFIAERLEENSDTQPEADIGRTPRSRLVEIAALAVAALESHDRKAGAK